MVEFITLDGARGEGGGQILRTALGLSVITGQPFRIGNIRARRKKPGLQRQHLAAVEAARRVGNAEVNGAAPGSAVLTFRPQGISPGTHHFATGSAGSATLVLQTVLFPLLGAGGPSELVLEGGTHNPWAPPWDFLDKAFLPLLRRMGADVTAALERRGFFPAGGGRVRVRIGGGRLRPIELHGRGEPRTARATAVVSRLPLSIAERELDVLRRELPLEGRVEEDRTSPGPGNAVWVEIDGGSLTEVFTGFGRRGVRAEAVAGGLAREVRRYLDSRAPVGEHLADQLMLPLALAGGGGFTTVAVSDHARTNREVIAKFLPVRCEIRGTRITFGE